MKTLFLLCALLLSTMATAQTTSTDDKQNDLLGQGTIHIGLGGGGGYGYRAGLNGRLVPRLQYFLKDGWSVGLEGRIGSVSQEMTYTGAGLSTRYYFVRDRRLALFGQAGATYGQTHIDTYEVSTIDPRVYFRNFSKDNAVQMTAGLGVHYRVANRWSLETIAERSLTNTLGQSRNYSHWQLGVGVNFRLNR